MKKEIKFEEAMEKLEDSVRKLEGGNMSLDESLATFEEAIKLVRICNDRLENAERKVKILTESSDGAVMEESFAVGDET